MSGQSKRKLAAIVVGDIAGYARLMGLDETGTHARVRQTFGELIEPTIDEHRGRLIKKQGDGFLAVFDSPVEAVRCAIVIQQSMVGRNLVVPDAQRMQFRIGINLGDIIVDADDIYGEGVNIAARLEQLAEPGNILISGGVYEQIRYKLVCGYQSLGDRKVKNIVDPVPIYRVLPDPAALPRAARGGRVRLGLLGAGAIALVGVGGWYASNHATEKPSETAPTAQPRGVIMSEPGTSGAPAGAPAAASPPLSPSAATAAVSSLPTPSGTPAPPAGVQGMAVVPTPPPAVAKPAIARVEEPAMISISGGTFRMGSGEDASEAPIHPVTVRPFLIAKYPVTVRQWETCVAAKACLHVADGADDAPISNVSWTDAQQFIAWLSQTSGRRYRLPSEAECEFAARGGTETRYWWGDGMKAGFADCKGCGGPRDGLQPDRVGALPPNPFGLYDIGDGVAEWIEDCWHEDYHGAPTDGSAWLAPDCRQRVLRGGSWGNGPSYVRSASRNFYDATVRYPTHGLRLARSP